MITKELESKLGLSKHTIRFYEKEGFIKPTRLENGYRDYTDEDIQILITVKFLRNLNISIDDVKSIMNGDISFNDCLEANHIHLEKQIKSLQEIQERVELYIKKDIPLIPALGEIKSKSEEGEFGFKKTTNAVSLCRRLTRKLVVKRIIIRFIPFFIYGFLACKFFSQSNILSLVISLLLSVFLTNISILIHSHNIEAFIFSTIVETPLDQFVEFLNDGIRYYKDTGYQSAFKYFYACLFNKDEKYVKNVNYDDIKQIDLLPRKRYEMMNRFAANELCSIDYKFIFKDGSSFYLTWPMTYDDDARFIGYILSEKVSNTYDPNDILYALKNGINLNDYFGEKGIS